MKAVREIQYATAAGESLWLDVHGASAAAPPPPHPAVVVIHGGGWSGGNRKDDLPFIPALCDVGLTVFSIDYRLAPQHRWPACIEDVRTAIAWVTAHAHEHGADATRLGLVGYSAGGHLAGFAAMVDRAPNVAAVAMLAAPTDLVIDALRRGGLSPSMKNLLGMETPDADAIIMLWRVSPINYVVPGLPPFLMIAGTKDESVPHLQAVHLHQRLSDMGVKSDLISLEGAEHRVRTWPQVEPRYMQRLAQWVQRSLSQH